MKHAVYVGTALAALASVAFYSPRGPAVGPATEEVRRLRAQGRLEPAGGIYRIGAIAGARVGVIHVTEGAWVQKGDLLVTLDGDAERATEIELIDSQLAEIDAKASVEEDFQRLLLRELELQRRRADEVEKFELPLRAQSLNRLREAVDIAQGQLRRLRELHKSGSVPSDQVEKQEIEFRKARSDLDDAQQAVDKLRRGVENGKLDLELQRAKIHAGTARVKAALPLRTLRAQRKLAEAKVAAGRIKAPITGQVLRLLTRPGETIVNAPVLQLGDTKRMFAAVEVDEADVAQVRPGQRATIKALGQSFSGVVHSVGLMIAKNELAALDPTARADARVVEVKVQLDSSDVAGRYSNLQVDVEIEASPAP